MRALIGLTTLLVLQFGCLSAAPHRPLPADSLKLMLAIRQESINGSDHPVVYLQVENTSGWPVAFSKTFGITNQPWLSFEIQRIGGETVYYPTEIDAFGEAPTYTCLGPGELDELRVDLLSWRPIVGGEVANERYSFDLAPGRYRIRAQYSDGPTRIKARCRGILGTTTSDWVEFAMRSPKSSEVSFRDLGCRQQGALGEMLRHGETHIRPELDKDSVPSQLQAISPSSTHWIPAC
jgi:hypothetical protein